TRLAFEVFQNVNEQGRTALGEKLVFKAPKGSRRGVLLRWHGYDSAHPTHPNSWVIELIDRQSGIEFHQVEGRFARAVRIDELDDPDRSNGQPVLLDRPSSWGLVRLLRA